MRTNFPRALGVAAVALLVACTEDPASTGPLTVQPTADVTADRSGDRRIYGQRDRLANPLVSEVMVVKIRHDKYNSGIPMTDVANWTNDLTGFVTGVAGRSPAYASTIAGALLPDMLLTYPKRDGTPVFWLSWVFGGYGGRSLPDDVVDIGLGAIFGTLLGNPNNVTPGLTTDNVNANDVPFRSTFPYLAAAH
jgi:hypothetical protein